jgi:hypothetical protein
MRAPTFRTLLLVAALGWTISAQEPEWRLTSPLTAAEKKHVLSLAATLKIDRPATIRSEQILHPMTCDALRIESVPAVDGRRRTWRRVWVTYTSWPNSCDRMKERRSPADTWVVAHEVSDVGAWRVTTAGQQLDVETPANIPHDEVAAIVEAVRTGRLVDRMPKGTRVPLKPVPKVDFRSIFKVWHDVVDQSRYVVRFRGTEVVFSVVVRGGQVHLLEWRTEIA